MEDDLKNVKTEDDLKNFQMEDALKNFKMEDDRQIRLGSRQGVKERTQDQC